LEFFAQAKTNKGERKDGGRGHQGGKHTFVEGPWSLFGNGLLDTVCSSGVDRVARRLRLQSHLLPALSILLCRFLVNFICVLFRARKSASCVSSHKSHPVELDCMLVGDGQLFQESSSTICSSCDHSMCFFRSSLLYSHLSTPDS